MKTDAFTKILLLAIAIFLGIIALRPLVQVRTVQASPGSFDYVKPFGEGYILDTRNGNVYSYLVHLKGECEYKGRLVELGKPLVKQRK